MDARLSRRRAVHVGCRAGVGGRGTVSLHLATAGVFQYLRNPMYAGLLLVVGGIGIAFASDWTLAMVVPVALILHHGVVLREERYLEARFGDSYRRYKDRVSRWGLF
ncbi:MAG: isoprenylcysteine carboxylmethyltransferase family protein [Rhizobiales bacterium]|nr:isoprenylcysteine carboxylmethyltransferase family protein [Hyphomicrobiales bacterium]